MDSDPHRLLADDPLRASPRRPRSKGGAAHTCTVCHSLTIPAVRKRVQRVTDDHLWDLHSELDVHKWCTRASARAQDVRAG